MIRIIISIIIILTNISCSTKKGSTEDDKNKIGASYFSIYDVRSDSILNLFNPLYTLNKLVYDSNIHQFELISSNYKNFNEQNNISDNDSLCILTKKNKLFLVSNTDKTSDSYCLYKYIGNNEQFDLSIIEVQMFETVKYILVSNEDGSCFLINGYPFFTNSGNTLISLSDEPYPVHFSVLEFFSIEKKIPLELKKQSDFWSENIISDIVLDNNNNLYIHFLGSEKNTKHDIRKINFGELNKKIESNQRQKLKQRESSDWYDIFYLYPFEESIDNKGTYYIEIEKENTSVFATSFGNRDVEFKYNVEPYCDNDTMYIVEKDLPEVLAKITRINNEYFIKSDLIKVFSDKIKPEKYGYKLEKGFPED